MPPASKSALVIGGGVAGATCAAHLASLAPNVTVTLLTPAAVVRVATPGALRGEVEVSASPAEAWARTAGVRVVRGSAGALGARAVAVADGDTRSIAFDVCCVATGARPRLPAVVERAVGEIGIGARVLGVRDEDDVGRLRSWVGRATRVLLVGNGGIGMEVAHGVSGGECEVVWAVRDRFVGGGFFDGRAGEAMGRFFERKGRGGRVGALVGSGETFLKGGEGERVAGSGVGPEWLGQKDGPVLFDKHSEIVAGETDGGGSSNSAGCPGGERGKLSLKLGCEIDSVALGADGELPLCVGLSDGTSVACDVIICATGVQPNVEWLGFRGAVPLDQSGDASVGGGILVSADTMRSVGRRKNVFAAGDCATVARNSGAEADAAKNWFQMRLWTQAAATGRVAAAAMAAALECGAEPFCGMEMELFAHGTMFFGERVVFLGRYNAQDLGGDYEVVEGSGEDHFIRVVVEDGRVRGALLIGDVGLAETYENLILDRLDISHIAQAELVDPSVDLEDYFD